MCGWTIAFSSSLDSTSSQTLKPIELTEKQQPMIKKVSQNHGVIWGMTFLDTNEILFTEREGNFKYLNLKTGKTKSIPHSLNVVSKGQGGLLDIRIHPDFKKNRLLYTCYSTELKGGYTTQLSLMKWENGAVKLLKNLFKALPVDNATNHFGCRIAFDDKGDLFMSIGDRTNRHNAQDLNTHHGKIIRLKSDTIPKDNPFYKNMKAQPEIWSYGQRNPQGLYWDDQRKILWEQEHGPRGGDEINVIRKGKNYGWPVITYGKEYWGPSIGDGTHKEGMEQPFYYYKPSIATCGLLVYSGKKNPKWKGHIFSGALAKKHLNQLVLQKGKTIEERRLFQNLKERIRNVVESPDGEIFFSTDSGNIYKILF